MGSSLLRPTLSLHTPTPTRSPQHAPLSKLSSAPSAPSAPSSPYGNKSPYAIRAMMISQASSKASSTPKRPANPRTQSSPSMTTAPMFPDEILENLYISDLETARAVLSPNYSSPGRPKVKYVLTLLDDAKDQPRTCIPTTAAVENTIGTDFILKLIKISDYTDVNILEKFPEACNFIRQSLANSDGGVLVHCRKGISRSGSVIVAYLMQEFGLGFDEALDRAKKSRAKIWPNRAFGEQLRLWKELSYTLADESGCEKAQYSEWKANHRFRPEVFEF